MGNSQSFKALKSIKLEKIMHDLDKTDTSISRTMVVTSTGETDSPYKVVIPVGEHDDDIITNITIPNFGFKSVVLTLGTQVFIGSLHNDNKWYFNASIPLFKIPNEKCTLSIYTLKEFEASNTINLKYDSYSAPDTIKQKCLGSPVTSNSLVYDRGCVY